eukprot:scaffold1753_cov153-Pinguiococcus_pyrenoidosus.AAC.1
MYFQVLFWMQAAIEGQERRLSYGAHAVLARLLHAWISQTFFAVREGVLCLLGSSVRAESVFCARALVAFATQTEQDAMLCSELLWDTATRKKFFADEQPAEVSEQVEQCRNPAHGKQARGLRDLHKGYEIFATDGWDRDAGGRPRSRHRDPVATGAFPSR